MKEIDVRYKNFQAVAFEDMQKEPIKVVDHVTGEETETFKITDKRFVPGRWIFDPKSGYFIEVKPARVVDKLATATMDAMGFTRRRHLDQTPVALPVGFIPPDPLEIRIARMLGDAEFRRRAALQDKFEDVFDLDVPDDPVDPFVGTDELPADPRIAEAFAKARGEVPNGTRSSPTDNSGKNKGKSKPRGEAQDPPAGGDDQGELEV